MTEKGFHLLEPSWASYGKFSPVTHAVHTLILTTEDPHVAYKSHTFQRI